MRGDPDRVDGVVAQELVKGVVPAGGFELLGKPCTATRRTAEYARRNARASLATPDQRTSPRIRMNRRVRTATDVISRGQRRLDGFRQRGRMPVPIDMDDDVPPSHAQIRPTVDLPSPK